MRVLLIEDDASLADALMGFLSARGFVCDWAADLQAARACVPLAHWGAVLLDWELPDGSGLSLIPTLRGAIGDASIVMLTARDQISDRIRGLDAGADDYLVKPFSPDELLARLRAIERRRSGASSADLRIGRLHIDLGRTQVRQDGVLVELTAKEWAVLRVLVGRPDRIHTRESLVDALYGLEADASSNTLEVFISNLRRKIGRERIETFRGLGYKFNVNP